MKTGMHYAVVGKEDFELIEVREGTHAWLACFPDQESAEHWLNTQYDRHRMNKDTYCVVPVTLAVQHPGETHEVCGHAA